MSDSGFERLTENISIVARGGWGGGRALSNAADCNVYLIDGGTEAAIIDAGCGNEPERIIGNIRLAGTDPRSVSKVILTHAHGDHSAGAAFLAGRLGAEIVAGTTTARALAEPGNPLIGELMPFRVQSVSTTHVDTWLEDGDKVRVGEVELTVLATPGHVLDGMCYLCRSEGKNVMFSGDTLIGNQPRADMGGAILKGMVGWLDRHWSSPMSVYVETLKRLGEMGVEMLLPGHGIPNDSAETASAIRHAIANIERLTSDADLFVMVALEK